jgi:hypothetical protein
VFIGIVRLAAGVCRSHGVARGTASVLRWHITGGSSGQGNGNGQRRLLFVSLKKPVDRAVQNYLSDRFFFGQLEGQSEAGLKSLAWSLSKSLFY